MAKIPVGRTIAQAYGFAFGDFFKILGVSWLPMALMWAPGLFLQQRIIAMQARLGEGDISAFREIGPILVPVYLAIFILLFMQMIGIAKLALGLNRGPGWFYFSLGKPVWRLIGSVLLLIVAMILGWIGVLLGGAALGFFARLLTNLTHSSLFTGFIGIVTALAMIALWCGYVYAWMRLGFLLVPVVAAEEQGFALGRSWSLGLGNFWRTFLVLLAVVGPFFILEFAFIFGFMLHGVSFPPAHADAAQMATFQAALNVRAAAMVAALRHGWYITYPVFFVLMVLFYGAAIGAQCFAWRALTQREPSGPVAAH